MLSRQFIIDYKIGTTKISGRQKQVNACSLFASIMFGRRIYYVLYFKLTGE